MTRKLFGTDGIRGTANTEPMTAETALRVAMATACHFRNGSHRHSVVIGKDTRLSGYMLEPAMTAGFIAMGLDVTLVGPMPTPAVAMLTRSMRADLGVMISASHNPFQDNGIKLFGPDGYKLSDDAEKIIEANIADGVERHLVPPQRLGRARRLEDAPGRYIEWVKNTFPRGLQLDGRKIVVDCAHGAAYRVAPTVLSELGAEVIPIGVNPNGLNINAECGATYPKTLQKAVLDHDADLGIALDGDGDRLLLVDEKGMPIDGDQVLALIAQNWHASGRLRGGGIVATVMSNLGLEQYIESLGLVLERAQVGDRYVVERMRCRNFNVGGEQSGHIVLSDYATTGDGLIAALQVLAMLSGREHSASRQLRLFEPLPQLLRNVRVNGGAPLDAASVKSAVAAGEARLGKRGRVLIRESGTEPVVRVMAEGDDEVVITQVVDDISAAIERAA
ncbi:MAG: phosphoglucosamine mutase [Alphaproteobacteria bacterium]|nr:phosphoglucosamine mutase [Alphaproteobacteria bacterium]